MNPLIYAGKHAIMRTISVFCVIAVMGFLALGVKRILYPPETQSYAQQAERIVNIEVYNPEDTFFLGVKIFGFKFGITKPTVKKMAEVVKEAEKVE